MADAGASAHRAEPGWVVLAPLCLGQFVVVVDLSIVNVALPAIRDDLGFTDTGLQWVVNAYAVTFCGFLLLGGKLADVFGRRRVFVFGLVVFTAASVVGALAETPGVLVAARAVQGFGGGVLSPATLTLVTTTFVGAQARARAMAAWSAVAGGGAAVGSVLGGLLTGLIDWRWILLVNVPIGVVAVVGALVLLRDSRSESTDRRLDVLGALLVTLGLSAVIYGTVSAGQHGWGSPSTLVPLLGGLALLGWFVLHEGKLAEHPVMPLRFFRIRSVSVANLTMFWLGVAVIAHFYFLSLYMQNVLHYSPLAAGLAFLPGSAAMTCGAYSGPVLMKRFGVRLLVVVGPLVTALGLVWLAFVPADGTYPADLLLPMVLVTFGTGVAMMPLGFSATFEVPGESAGLASGMFNTTRQVGGAIGLAVLAAISVARTTSVLDSGTDRADAMVSGYRLAFLVGAGFAVLAVLTATAMPRPAPPTLAVPTHAGPTRAAPEGPTSTAGSAESGKLQQPTAGGAPAAPTTEGET
ncbi:MFS transporter [Actinosynnema sp. NPDC023658]|uniref:MFS transporter n=1 Tax=Actinosynnema sp. NPDC023658 TaxID=3155465 RepID=UPI00340396EF